MVACAFMVPLLTPAVYAQDASFVDLLAGRDSPGLVLTRSGTPSSPPCVTPERQQGVCSGALTCEAYLPLLGDLRNSTVIAFFRKRVCRQGVGFIHVCCPLKKPSQAQSPTLRPQDSHILFNQQADAPHRHQEHQGHSHRPSQRPNARRPAQGGFRDGVIDKEDDKLEFPPTHSPPTTLRPQPPTPRISLPHTTTTRPPTLAIPPSTPGFLMSPDREPTPDSHASQNQEPAPTEPPVPPVLPDEGECGTTTQGKTGTMPWVVGLGVLDKTEFRVTCWAALVSRQHVIAAAHCWHSTALTHARLGDLQQRGTPLDVPIHSLLHPNYNPNTRENDLAVVTLANPVTFTDNIQPVCLPFRYRLDGFRGQQLQVVGWGGLGDVEAGSVQVIGAGQCRDSYRSPSLVSSNEVAPFSRPSSSSSSSSLFLSPRSTSIVVDKRNLCGSPAPTVSSPGSCLSDHGAPLFYHDEDTTGLHFLAGVSSLGKECGTGPGLYTRVGAFIPWLVKQLDTAQAPVPRPPPSPTRHSAPNLTFSRRG